MSSLSSDAPIEDAKDDLYGVASFAHMIADAILNVNEPVGTTIAVNGPWGSGKSSVLNLVRNILGEHNDERLTVTEFKCWWFRGEDTLALAFLQHLHKTLKNSLGDKVLNLIPSMARTVMQGGTLVGQVVGHVATPFLGTIATQATKITAALFPEGDTLDKTFHKLEKALRDGRRRFVIALDDMDRLNPDESLALLRIIKSVGRLPNVIYLVAFDRQLTEKAIVLRYPSEGPHYLEKIIQAAFHVPAPLQTDLNDALLSMIYGVCGHPKEDEAVRFMNVFYECVVPYISTPRHVVRLQNAVNVTYPAIGKEINRQDFIALETIRLYEPRLFVAIQHRQNEVCGASGQGFSKEALDSKLGDFLEGIPPDRHGAAKRTLQRLFPRLGTSGFGREWVPRWDSERRVCVEAHFESYFRLVLSGESLSTGTIASLVERAGDRGYLVQLLRAATATLRKGKGSMVPVYLDELNTHADSIALADVSVLIGVLFEMYDEIDLQKDAEIGGSRVASTMLRVHWLIRRLTLERFSLEERTELFLASLRNASLGWLVDFTSSVQSSYSSPEKRAREDDAFLVAERALPDLIAHALNAIRNAAANLSLLRHPHLQSILYRWREFQDGDCKEVLAWTNSIITNDEALVYLARAFTGYSWTTGLGGFGGLGDRVSKRNLRAQIPDDIDILDISAFRAGLERINREGVISKESLDTVRQFLEAWNSQQQE